VIIGLGIDLVEVSRIEAILIRHPARARDRLFTALELADCEGRRDSIVCLAARFAAKEAFLKALGTGLRAGIAWRDISIRRGEFGRPELVVTGRAAEKLEQLGGSAAHVSLTHDAGFAAAVVAIETG